MNWLKDNPFWKVEETTKKETKEVIQEVPSKVTIIPEQVNIIPNNIQVDDSKYVDILNNVLAEESSKNTNFDLNKFLELISKFNTTLSERERYYTAFISAKSLMGVSINTLIESSQKYLTILENEQNEFSNSLRSFEEKEISPLSKRIEEINIEEENSRKAIQDLNEKLNKLSQEKIETTMRIKNKETEVLSKKVCFESAFKKVSEYIIRIRENINNYLPKE